MKSVSVFFAGYICLITAIPCLRVASLGLSFLFLPIPTIFASSLDPLARQQAQWIADDAIWVQPRSESKDPHPLGIQTLSIEIQETKENLLSPLLKVYQYHYDLMQARVLTIDTDNSRVLRSQVINSVHLPLNQTEISFAHQLLQSNTAIVDQLRNEQALRGQTAFQLLSELDVKASIYEPLDSTHSCFEQRCALLSLFDNTRTVFSAEPVINLQSRKASLLRHP
ncbi:MAG: hypothetical protein AB8B87_21105 [Granulosicoccus sp.]